MIEILLKTVISGKENTVTLKVFALAVLKKPLNSLDSLKILNKLVLANTLSLTALCFLGFHLPVYGPPATNRISNVLPTAFWRISF